MTGPERSPSRERARLLERRFVCALPNYEGKSPRIIGLQKLEIVGAKTPNPVIVTDQVFRVWKDNGRKFPFALKRILTKTFKEVEMRDPGQGVHVGRGTFVEDVEEPLGPRSADIHDATAFLKELEKQYNFILDETDYDKPGSEFPLLTHPFLNTVNPPKQEHPRKPYPGGAAFMRADGTVEIHATFGQDEAVQSHPHDVYTLERTVRGYDIGVNVHFKGHTLVPVEGKYKKIELTKKVAQDRALEVNEIAEIARILRELSKKFEGQFRIEFMGTPTGLVVRENTQFAPEENITDSLNVEGAIYTVAGQTAKEIQVAVASHTGKEMIAYADHTLFEARNFRLLDVLRSEAVAKEVELVVLAYGNSGVTGHRVRNLTDAGIPVIFIGEERVEDGEKIRVLAKEGRYQFEKENPTQWISDIVADSTDRWGGKAVGLKLLMDMGFYTPNGFAVETSAFRKHLEQSGISIEESLPASLGQPFEGEVRDSLEAIREKVISTPLDAKTLDFIMNEIARLGEAERISIRSSANCEDQAGHAFAGRFRSVIGVDKNDRDAVEKAVKDVYSSVFQEGVYSEAKNPRVNIPFESIEMALVCHPELPGEKQGGLHTRGDREGNVVIEAGSGAGSTVDIVGTQMTVVVQRSIDKIISNEGKNKDFLSPKEIFLIRNMAVAAENAFETPQEMEWTLIGNDVVFLQARPQGRI